MTIAFSRAVQRARLPSTDALRGQVIYAESVIGGWPHLAERLPAVFNVKPQVWVL